VEALDVDGVVQFAQEQGLDEEDVAVLRKRKIRGRVLQSMTVEEFMKAGLELGPAKELMLALDKVFGRGECTRLRFFLLFCTFAFHLPPCSPLHALGAPCPTFASVALWTGSASGDTENKGQGMLHWMPFPVSFAVMCGTLL
jgi:hypothetical protein